MRSQLFLIFIFWAIVLSISFPVFDHYDFSYSIDSESYMKMAEGNFDVKPKHRYRPLIPWTVSALSEAIFFLVPEFEKAAILQAVFYLLNSIINALFVFFCFKIAAHNSQHFLYSILGILPVLNSQWIIYTTGIPLTDSLYFLSLTLGIYGFIAKKFNWIVICALLGPLAKDSYLLFLPVFCLGVYLIDLNQKIFKIFMLLLFSVSAFLGIRLLIDFLYETNFHENSSDALSHLSNIGTQLNAIFSWRGILQITGAYGAFSIAFLFPLLYKFIFKEGNNKERLIMIFYLIIVFSHMLLSGDLSRMFFLSSPIFVVAFAKLFEHYGAKIISTFSLTR